MPVVCISCPPKLPTISFAKQSHMFLTWLCHFLSNLISFQQILAVQDIKLPCTPSTYCLVPNSVSSLGQFSWPGTNFPDLLKPLLFATHSGTLSYATLHNCLMDLHICIFNISNKTASHMKTEYFLNYTSNTVLILLEVQCSPVESKHSVILDIFFFNED